MATAAEKRRAEAARIKAENEARKERAAARSVTSEQKANEAAAVSAISGGDASPATLAAIGPVNVAQTLPRAFIPVKNIVDMNGNVIPVDINGRDEAGNLIKEAPEPTSNPPAGVAGANWVLKPDGSYELQVRGMSAQQWNQGVSTGAISVQGGQTVVSSPTTPTPTTSMDVIKSGLRALGLKGNIVDSGALFIDSLLRDGIDFDNAIDVFLENKEYTFKNGKVLESPFYKEYGFLNEYAAERKEAGELFGLVTGVEQMVKKYNLSAKFGTREKLIEMVKNDVTVKDFDMRANMARLKAITADPVRVEALRNLGFIKSNEDLTDFYLDTTIGIEKFEDRRRTAYLTTEALRRASAGITIDTARMTQLAATLGAQGYTAEQVERLGGEAYETISQQLPQLTKLSGIFERGEAVKPQDIQKELESEQLLGMASQRRKRLEQANIDIFAGKAGRAYTQQSTAGMI